MAQGAEITNERDVVAPGETTMSGYLKVSTASCFVAGLLAVGALCRPEPAHAQFGGIAGMLMHMGGFHFRTGGGGGSRRSRGGGDKEDSDSSGNSARNDKVLASLGAPPSNVQVAIFKAVIIPPTLGAIGTKEVMEVGKVASKDGDRDWTCMVSELAKSYEKGGDVTARKVEEALDGAIKGEKLDTFESFGGENWTDDNLRAKILNRVTSELHIVHSRKDLCGAAESADNLGNKPMDELKTVIQKAAQTTYRQIFDVSEMLAANRGLARFVQRLYQIHGSLPNDASAQVRQNADEMIVNEAKGALERFEGSVRPDKDGYGYALHYRAERILYDCLSENVIKMSGKTVGAIRKDIRETSKSDCVPWVAKEFASGEHAPKPVSFIWSADASR
jgi:hypothetical protein